MLWNDAITAGNYDLRNGVPSVILRGSNPQD